MALGFDPERTFIFSDLDYMGGARGTCLLPVAVRGSAGGTEINLCCLNFKCFVLVGLAVVLFVFRFLFLFFDALVVRATYRVAGEFYKNIIRVQKKITINQALHCFGLPGEDNIGKLNFCSIQAAPSFSSCVLLHCVCESLWM